MITANIFQSVEFYVIAATVAAFVVAICARGESRGPVREILLAGILSPGPDENMAQAAIGFSCLPDGTVMLTRYGIAGVTMSGAVSLAIQVKGFEVYITERDTAGRPDDLPAASAMFNLDFLATEHYFIRYTTATTAHASTMVATLTLSNRPGNKVMKQLV